MRPQEKQHYLQDLSTRIICWQRMGDVLFKEQRKPRRLWNVALTHQIWLEEGVTDLGSQRGLQGHVERVPMKDLQRIAPDKRLGPAGQWHAIAVDRDIMDFHPDRALRLQEQLRQLDAKGGERAQAMVKDYGLGAVAIKGSFDRLYLPLARLESFGRLWHPYPGADTIK